MNETSYTVQYLYEGRSPKEIPLEYTDKHGNPDWIDMVGNRMQTIRPKGGKGKPPEIPVKKFNLISPKTVERNGKTFSVMAIELSYVDDHAGMPEDKKIQNLINRNAHALLKQHPNIVLRNKTGGNDNPNQAGEPLYELIETSTLLKQSVEDTNKKTAARILVKEMFEENRDEFIELCYACEIPVDGNTVEKMFSIINVKIESNIDLFMETVNHRERKFISLIKKAQHTNFDGDLVITTDGSLYLFDGEVIGQTTEEIVYYFGKNPLKRDSLYRKMNIQLPEFDVKEIPEPAEFAEKTEQNRSFDKNFQNSRLSRLKNDISGAFARYKKSVTKSPTHKKELLKDLEAELKEKRDKYSDMLEVYDALISEQKVLYEL